MVPKDQLLKEREEKKRIEAEKELRKQKQLAAAKAKEDQKKIPPTEMFKQETNLYSKFDDKVIIAESFYFICTLQLLKQYYFQGLPTHDAAGQELSNGLVKKLQKLQITREKEHNENLNSLKNAS